MLCLVLSSTRWSRKKALAQRSSYLDLCLRKTIKPIRVILALILCFSANLALAAAEDDPDKFQLEAITLKFMPGKGLEDLLALREQFGTFAKAVSMQYYSSILVPWAVSKAGLPASDDWDGIWFGVTGNALQ